MASLAVHDKRNDFVCFAEGYAVLADNGVDFVVAKPTQWLNVAVFFLAEVFVGTSRAGLLQQ